MLATLSPLIVAVGFYFDDGLWSLTVLWQIGVTLVICLLLLQLGYQIRWINKTDDSIIGRRFGIGELMGLTTATVPAALLIKRYDLWAISNLPWHLSVPFGLFAMLLGIVSAATMMLILRGSQTLGWLIAAMFAVFLAAQFWTWDFLVRFGRPYRENWRSLPGTAYSWQTWPLKRAHELSHQWLIWVFLFAAFLTAMLAVFRYDECQIGRQGANRG